PFSGEGFSETIRRMAKQRSRTVLTSGFLEPANDGGQHSLLAEAFLRVLQENSGLLSGEHLFRSLRIGMPLPQSTSGLRGPDYAPIKFAHEAGDFIFVRTAPKAAADRAHDAYTVPTSLH